MIRMSKHHATPPTDLERKCGSCALSRPAENVHGGSKCYIECTHTGNVMRWDARNMSAVRPRTRPGCRHYKPNDNNWRE